MNTVRIAYLVNVFPKLSETFIAHEITELCRRGSEVRIFSLRQPQDELRHPIIARAGLDQLVSYEVAAFPEQLKAFRPQLLHAHFATEPTAAARHFAAELNVPFTFTAHGYDIRRKPPPDFHERALAAASVITVSQANADYITQQFQVPREHIRIIPCGVDLRFFRPARNRAQANSTPLILCVARHVKVKNLTLLLGACAELRKRNVPFRCVMIGDGPLHAELEILRNQLGLKQVVQMPGAADQEQVLRWYQQAAVAVLTSENEGMPVCLMEAAACAVPAVATAVGGIPELLDDAVTGLLAPPGDPLAFANALHRLLSDAVWRHHMGIAARARVEQHFTLSGQVDRLLALWSELINSPALHHASA